LADAVIVAHQFETPQQQRMAVTLGMWVFLATEVMFFGGIILAYTVYRWMHPLEFHEGSAHLKMWLGAGNTAVLLCSSFTMALAVHASHENRPRHLAFFLLITMLLASTFLGIKAYEYLSEYHEGLVPVLRFTYVSSSPEVNPRHVELFFAMYFAMTSIHAFHMIMGLVIMGLLVYRYSTRVVPPEHSTHVEAAGLYWHFVDVVWVFLFPLLYLIG
jgi:cytochrome c oxidase subunit III